MVAAAHGKSELAPALHSVAPEDAAVDSGGADVVRVYHLQGARLVQLL